jgi:hypothetical protein
VRRAEVRLSWPACVFCRQTLCHVAECCASLLRCCLYQPVSNKRNISHYILFVFALIDSCFMVYFPIQIWGRVVSHWYVSETESHGVRCWRNNFPLEQLWLWRRSSVPLFVSAVLLAMCGYGPGVWIRTGTSELLKCLVLFSMALPAHSGPRPLIQFRNHFSQMVGLLGRVISLSQGRYLNTE